MAGLQRSPQGPSHGHAGDLLQRALDIRHTQIAPAQARIDAVHQR
jgi:hypothetical protein